MIGLYGLLKAIFPNGKLRVMISDLSLAGGTAVISLPSNIPERERWIALDIAEHYIGTWYKWGGDSPAGFDCSGLVIEVLKSVGKFPRGQDDSAIGLYARYPHIAGPKPGALVFFDDGGTIAHVEMCIDDKFTIGASGGGHLTVTVADAIRDNAFIKIRPITRPRHITGYCDPFAV